MAPHAEIINHEDTSTLEAPVTKSIQQHNNTVFRTAPASHQVEATTDTTAAIEPDVLQRISSQRPRFSHEDVIPHRQATGTRFSKTVAASSSAQMFKSDSALSRPEATRSFYDSHLSREAKARKPSSLKGAMKYLNPKTISLCGGLPSSEYFPFEQLSFTVPNAPDFSSATTSTATAGKYDCASGASDYDLSIALNYGQSMGPPQLIRFLTEHTEMVHDIPYSNWEICTTQGSTSALDIALRMFCERGDSVIMEEYSFSSAIESCGPMGLTMVGVKMDAEGLDPVDLDYVLSNWSSGANLSKNKYNDAPFPKVMYTVPTGQNPTGATQGTQRRKDILKVCEKHNIFVLEDEPYYFLQMEQYARQQSNGTNGHAQPSAKKQDLKDFISSLIPSYLHLDSSGRVLRMDSFSKIIAPGSRVGWVTGPADLVERFVRASEVSAQTPSGFSTMALFKLLEDQWGHEGFLQWLQVLRSEYSQRRNIIVKACEDYLPTEVIGWTAPMAGMFHWLQVDGSKHALWREESATCQTEAERRALLQRIEEEIFVTGTEHDVLTARGSWFRSEKVNAPVEIEQSAQDLDTTIYFRMTFAAASSDQITEAVRRFGDALRQEFAL